MKNDELLKFGISHSCQVFQLTNNFESACGFILKQENFSLFLTVDHLFKGITEYAQGSIPIKINSNHKTLVLKKTFLPVGMSGNEILDIRYCELKPTDSPSSYVDGNEVKTIPFENVCDTNFAEEYYFVGRVCPKESYNSDEESFYRERRYIEYKPCFKEITLSKENDLSLIFELPDYGEIVDMDYKGSSGTPIYNRDGQLVSMLIGKTSNRELLGLNLFNLWPFIFAAYSLTKRNVSIL